MAKGRCSSSPAPARARRACSRTASRTWSAKSWRGPRRSWRSRSPTRPPASCGTACTGWSAPRRRSSGSRPSTLPGPGSCGARPRPSPFPAPSPSTTRPMRSPRRSAPARTWASTSGPPASICRASIGGRTRASCPAPCRCPTGTFPARSRSGSTIATSARCRPGARSISGTSSSASSSFSPSTPGSKNGTRSASATSSSTSSRTPIPPSTRFCAGSPRCTGTSASWATTIKASTAGAGRRCRTSSISRVTSPAPG